MNEGIELAGEKTSLLESNKEVSASYVNEETSPATWNAENRTSNFATIVHLFKGYVGVGFLSLPAAVKHAGVVVGPVGLLLVGILSVHCMHLLVKCSHFFCKRLQRSSLSYGEVSEEAFKPLLKMRSHWARYTVNVFLCVTQLGFCIVYLLFIATTIMEVGKLEKKVNFRTIIATLVIPVVALSYMKSLEKLAYVSTISNVLCFGGFAIIFQFLARHVHNPKDFVYFAGWKELPLFLSIVIFAFEGIGVVLPLENRTRNPQDFCWVINVAMGIVALLFLLMGTFGYMAFGESTAESIPLNLPRNWLYDGVKVSYAIVMFGTYFIQFYVPMQIMLPFLMSKTKNYLFEYVFRTGFVLLTAILAISIPQLENFIALIGSVASSGLAIIFPPLFHLLTFREHGISRAAVAKDLFIISVGIFAFVVGGFTSVVAIVTNFRNV